MDNTRLSRIELFAFNTRPSFMHRLEPSGCWYGVLKLTCGEQISYGECILCADDNAVDLIKWGSYLKPMRHCTVEEAFGLIQLHEQEWAPNQRTLLQSALASIHQAGQLRSEITAGASRNEYRINTCYPGTESASQGIHQAEDQPDSSLLFEEAVAYYSLL